MKNLELAELRAEIDALDERLIEMMAQRLEVVQRVVDVKLAHGIPATVPERIDEVIGHVSACAARRGLPAALAENVWRALITETIRYEEARIKQGPR